MTSFFSINEAAHRYDKHRPRVHSQIFKWLADSGIELNFNRSIDIACGTGHSTIPLTKISKETIGIDTSAEMLEKAAEKGLDTKNFLMKISIYLENLISFQPVWRFIGLTRTQQ